MNKFEFNKAVEALETIYGMLAVGPARDAYFDQFKNVSEEEFKAALERIIQTHTYKSFPLPAHIFGALRKIRDAKDKAGCKGLEQLQRENAGCPECSGIGIIIANLYGYDRATYCTCPVGERMKRNHRKYFESEHGKDRWAEAKRERLATEDQENLF